MRTPLSTLAIGAILLTTQGATPDTPTTSSLWCDSDVWIGVPSAHLIVCPQGDGETLAEAGAVIKIKVVAECTAVGAGIDADPVVLLRCDGASVPWCLGTYNVTPDGLTDENSIVTVSGSVRAGGYTDGVLVTVRGQVATGVCWCDGPYICLPITLVSPDIDGSMTVDVVDLALFATTYYTSAGYDPAHDFNGDGATDVVDLSLFAMHLNHSC